jgi:hypothetical protein
MAMAHIRGLKTRAGTALFAILGAVAAGGLLFSATSASAQGGGCSREDLQDNANDYLAAQAAADPTKMHMNLWVNYNEQLEDSTMSGGLLGKPMKVDFTRALYDTTSCTIFLEQVVTNPARPMVIGTIVQTAGGNAVTGMQVVWTDQKNGWLFNPANTKKYSEAENWSPIPAADRDSRATLQAAADAYLNLFADKNAKVPWGTPCARLEGGAYTSKAQPGNLNPDDSCNVGVPSGVPIVDRIYVIDPELGAVSVLSHFGKDQEPDFHTFRVEHGKLKYVHTITACTKVPNCGFKPQAAPPQAQAQATR